MGETKELSVDEIKRILECPTCTIKDAITQIGSIFKAGAFCDGLGGVAYIESSAINARSKQKDMPESVKNQLNRLCKSGNTTYDFMCSAKKLANSYANVKYAVVQDVDSFNISTLTIKTIKGANAQTLAKDIIILDNTLVYDTCLWAHELKHTQQFRDKGTRDFCIAYVMGGCIRKNKASMPCDLEREAYTVQSECQKTLRSSM